MEKDKIDYELFKSNLAKLAPSEYTVKSIFQALHVIIPCVSPYVGGKYNREIAEAKNTLQKILKLYEKFV